MKISAQAFLRRTALYAAGASAIAALLLSGCGGSSGRRSNPSSASLVSASRAKGNVSFTVTWPDRTRLVPIAANSIRITLTRNPKAGLPTPQTLTKVLTRPAGQPLTTTTQFDNLELGDYVATATAYPNPDASGTPQAAGPGDTSLGSASMPVTVVAGLNPTLGITMNSTIVNFAVLTASNFNLRAGQQRTFTATATDANGNLVIVNQSISWSVSPSNLFRLTTNGNMATLTYIGPIPITQNVTATVTATDTESGKSASATAVYAVVGLSNPNNGWPKFHGNAQNTGQAPSSVTGDATQGISTSVFQTGDAVVFSSPAIGPDGTIYIGSYDGNLYALTQNGNSLDIKWKFQTGGIIESSPAIGADGTVYVGSFDNNVYAIAGNQPDPNNVQPIWVFPAGGPVQASPAIDKQGFVYIGGTDIDHNLYKLDGLDGSLVWTYTTGGGIQTAPALTPDERIVIVGSLDGSVYFINTAGLPDGTTSLAAAPFATGGLLFSSSAAVAMVNGKNVAFIGSLDGKVYALGAQTGDAQLGRPIWATPFDANAPIYSSPAVATDAGGNATAVYVGSFDNGSLSGGVITDNNHLYHLDPTNGSLVWQFPAAGDPAIGTITSSPAIGRNGSIYFGCYDGNVYAVLPDGTSQYGSLVSGAPRGVQTGDTIDSSPAIAQDGTVYLGSFNGRVFSIR